MTDAATTTNQAMQQQEPSPAVPSAPERVTVEVAVGPNVDGLDHQVRAAHGVDAPDPANADDTGEFAEPPTPNPEG